MECSLGRVVDLIYHTGRKYEPGSSSSTGSTDECMRCRNVYWQRDTYRSWDYRGKQVSIMCHIKVVIIVIIVVVGIVPGVTGTTSDISTVIIIYITGKYIHQ